MESFSYFAELGDCTRILADVGHLKAYRDAGALDIVKAAAELGAVSGVAATMHPLTAQGVVGSLATAIGDVGLATDVQKALGRVDITASLIETVADLRVTADLANVIGDLGATSGVAKAMGDLDIARAIREIDLTRLYADPEFASRSVEVASTILTSDELASAVGAEPISEVDGVEVPGESRTLAPDLALDALLRKGDPFGLIHPRREMTEDERGLLQIIVGIVFTIAYTNHPWDEAVAVTGVAYVLVRAALTLRGSSDH